MLAQVGYLDQTCLAIPIGIPHAEPHTPSYHPDRYAYVDSKTALLSGAVEFHVTDRLRPSDDFFSISLTTIHMQKKCILKSKLNVM